MNKKIIGILICMLFVVTNFNIESSMTNNIIADITDSYYKYDFSYINITFESCNYSLYGEIYYPSNESGLYPGIVFCEGSGGYISVYNWIPKALAKEGYVVLIFDFPDQGKSEGFFPVSWNIDFPIFNIYLRFGAGLVSWIHYFLGEWVKATMDALTFLLEESAVNQIINKTSIGLIGHSMGGFVVTDVASIDKRVDTVIALSQGISYVVPKINVPIQFQLGMLDFNTMSIPIILSCYKKANPPKELITISGGNHAGFTTVLGSFCPCPSWQKDICLRYTIGWFDYFLKNKTESYKTIITGIDHLSKLIKSRYNFGQGDYFLEYE